MAEQNQTRKALEAAKFAIKRSTEFAMRNHNANIGWWNDPNAYHLIRQVNDPTIVEINEALAALPETIG